MVALAATSGGILAWKLNSNSAVRPLTDLEKGLLAQNSRFDWNALYSDGVTVLPEALSIDDIKRFKESTAYNHSLRYLEMKLRRVESGGTRDSAKLSNTSSTKLRRENIEGTSGRFHRTVFDLDSMKILESFEENWKDMVSKYLNNKNVDEHNDGTNRIVLSQLQLLVSAPESVDQFFHQDNARKGLTILIPLEDVAMDMGPTQLLPGTHLLSEAYAGERRWDRSMLDATRQAVGRSLQAGPLRASLKAGTAVVYDGRVLHRGLANRSQIPRPVLVYRYDLFEYPPPQAGILRTTAMRFFGYTLNTLCQLNHLLSSINRME